MATLTLSKSQINRAYLFLVAGVTCIGFAGVFTKVSGAPGVVAAAWRLTVASLILLIPFLLQPKEARQISRPLLGWAMLGGVMFALDMGLWNVALDYTTVGNATFLVNTSPIWVGLITLFILREPLPRLFWPGLAVAMTGAALIIFGGADGVSIQRGDVLGLLAGFFWACYQVITRHVRTNGVTNLTNIWIAGATGAALLVPAALLSGHSMTGYGLQGALAFLAMGLISQVGGYLGINYSLAFIPASKASIVIFLQPIVATIAAFVFLGEAFGGWQLVGGLAILAGVYLVTMVGRDA